MGQVLGIEAYLINELLELAGQLVDLELAFVLEVFFYFFEKFLRDLWVGYAVYVVQGVAVSACGRGGESLGDEVVYCVFFNVGDHLATAFQFC